MPVLILFLTVCSRVLDAQEATRKPSEFRPALENVLLEAATVRPGDTVGVVYYFRNSGAARPEKDYRVFVHFERTQSCDKIPFQQDHEPTLPARTWDPGRLIVDGPHEVMLPPDAEEGEYFIHVGLFTPGGAPHGERVYETYWTKKLTVSATAAGPQAPPPLSEAELAGRTQRLLRRLEDATPVENALVRLSVSRATGGYEIADKTSGEVWTSSASDDGFARLTISDGRQQRILRVASFSGVSTEDSSGLRMLYTPPAEERDLAGLLVNFSAALVEGAPAVEFKWTVTLPAPWRVESLRFPDKALWVTDAQQGTCYIPSWVGLAIPADSGRMFSRRFPTYSWGGCQMQMAGLTRRDAGCLISWSDPYVAVSVESALQDLPIVPGQQVLALSLDHGPSSKGVRLDLIPKGGYVDLCHAYRPIARAHGFLKRWSEKVKENPSAEKLIGAPIFKPFTLSRTIPGSRFYHGKGEDHVSLGYTFEETARIAEHLRKDVGIERGVYVLAGWIHRGYDNQHPDILPAAPECGGNDALHEASERIRATGYLFGLHDNYLDFYRDAPSWDEKYIVGNKDGSVRKAGNWAGGQAWFICPKMALELASRPDRNMPKVKELFSPTAYFTDTTFAVGMTECYSKAHPLDFHGDIECRQALADYARSVFGVHGSEMGMEWAVPHSHYFEGLLSYRRHQESLPPGAYYLPLFELVYRDCVALYTHQGDRAGPASAEYILQHVGLGRMPLYQFGPHLYFESPDKAQPARAPVLPGVERVTARSPREFEITYRWTVNGPVAVDATRVFVHFTDREGEIKFQDDHVISVPSAKWKKGQVILDGPRTVSVPEKASGLFEVRVGMLHGSQRLALTGRDDGEHRYRVGVVRVSDKGVSFQPRPQTPELLDTSCFARSDGGWGEAVAATGSRPCVTDVFIRNTYEVLSPINQLTAMLPMTSHRFLTTPALVASNQCHALEETIFGDNAMRIVINGSGKDVQVDGESLPPFGFIARSPTLLAFHANTWSGVKYPKPAMFVIRSFDERPIETALGVRIFHAFGDPRVRFPNLHRRGYTPAGKKISSKDGVFDLTVKSEETLEFR